MGKALRLIFVILLFAGAGYAGQLYWKRMQHPAAGNMPAPAGGPPTGMAGKGGPPAGMSMPVVTKKIAPENVTITLSAVGSLLAGEAAEIHAEIAGQIEKIFFEEGQPVKKGELLMQIDKSLIQTELARAQAAYDATAATFSRDDKLKSSGYVSNQKWDLSKSDLQSAKAAVDSARIRLEKTSIRAPFDGIAGLRSFSVGDYAETGQSLTTVVSIDPLKIEFSVPEKDYGAVSAGQKIRFSVDAWPNEAFEGKIYAVAPRIDPATRNFSVKAEIPNPKRKLRPGMYARIDIATSTKKDVLMVPEEALIPSGSDTFVFAVEDGKAAMRKITPGLRRDGAVEALDGLSPGAEIITAGAMRVRDGMPVMSQPPGTGK